MNLTNRSTTAFLGFIGGVVLTLALTVLIRISGAPSQGEVLAKVGNETLTREELSNKAAPDIIPIENDEYRILKQGVDEWLTTKLLEKESKMQGVPVDELYRREIWSKIQVSYADISEYYSRYRELFSETFEKVSYQIAQELRRAEYSKLKAQYIEQLEKKYKAKIYLKEPRSFVEGLAVPSLPAPALIAIPTTPTESKSEIGSPPSQGPETAPITLTEFSDFHCPFCKKAFPTMKQIMQNYPGKVHWVFRHFPLSTTPGEGSFLTHEASVCAQEQGKFWEFHDEVYTRPSPPAEPDLYGIGDRIGLDRSKFQECLKSGRYREFLKQESSEGTRRGVQGTPTVFVNDKEVSGAYPYDYFVKIIEGILNPDKNQPPPSPAEAQAPPNPSEPVQFNDLEGRPTLGPKDAPVTIVEFSDFHCPFCKRVTPTLDQLMKNYPGKIRRVWRHYPLAMHVGADRTHEASECANEQGKFWEYHDKLFETQGGPRDDAALLNFAEQIGLNKEKFGKCLSGEKYKALVQEEIAKGNQAGVQGTPAVFVNGRLVSGAQPYENFDRIVSSQLGKS